MSLKFDTFGRPMVECINPNCGKLHKIHRRGDYISRVQVRVVCRACGTKWHLTDNEIERLKEHFEKYKEELEEKRQKKIEKIQKKEEKTTPPKKEKESKAPEKTEKQTKKNKSWLESFLE